MVNSCGFRLEKQNLRLLHGLVQGCVNSVEGVSRNEANLRHTLPLMFSTSKFHVVSFSAFWILKRNLSHVMYKDLKIIL